MASKSDRFYYENFISSAEYACKASEYLSECVKEYHPENIREILRLCMRYETPVVVGTDAHHTSGVGQFGEALAALEDTGFPEELVANTSLDKLMSVLKRNALR